MVPDLRRTRLQVRVPRGPMPRWLGDALSTFDALGTVHLSLDVDVSVPPPRSKPTLFDRGWRCRLPVLHPWRPDTPERAALSRWTDLAATGVPDVSLSLTTDAGAASPSVTLAAAPLQWALVDDDGAALWTAWPMLRQITDGRGLRLHCLELDLATAVWRLRRTLHVPTRSRYASGLAALAASVARLLEGATSDLCAERGTPRSTFFPRWDPPRAEPPTRPSAAAMRGSWREAWRRHRERWSSEYWRIGVIDLPIAALVRPGPLPPIRWLTRHHRAGYWADPYGVPGDSKRVACEFFDERSGLGRLELLGFDASDRVVRREVLPVAAGRHVSFPSWFELDGKQYGLAETVATRECVLYEVGADGVWRRLTTLLHDVAAADPVLFAAEGRYWLAYTDADLGESDNLCLHHAERMEGPWSAHACNPVKVDVTSARMAGRPFIHEGVLYRPAQDCLRTYGAAVVVHRVLELTPTAYREVAVRRLEPGRDSECPDGIHSLNAWGDRTLVDGKRHAFNLVAVGRKLRLALSAGARPTHGAPVGSAATPSTTGQRAMVYLPHLRMGGGETSMLRLAEGLAAAGLQVDLVVHTLATAELEVPPGVNVVSLDCTGTLAAIGRLAACLRRLRPRWVLSAFPHTNVAAIVARTLSGTDACCVLTEHAPVSQQIGQQGGWRYRLLPPLIRWAYARADEVVAVSNGVRDDLQAIAGLERVPRVIYNPVLPAGLADELGRPPDHPWLRDPALDVVLSVSRLSAEKDLPTLLRAFALVHRVRPSARLLMAGDGPERSRLEALRDQWGLGDVVRLPGRTDQPLRWMRHARVFVLASRFEGFGNVLIEALACGTPVVSTDCPVGPREVLHGGAYGALVAVGDAAAMADEILRAIDARSPPPEARDAALAYTQAHACDAYLQLFESLRPQRLPTC